MWVNFEPEESFSYKKAMQGGNNSGLKVEENLNSGRVFLREKRSALSFLAVSLNFFGKLFVGRGREKKILL